LTVQEKLINKTVRKDRARLLNFIKKRIPVKEDAEDILQDVFCQLIICYDDIKSFDKITSWLFTVARNKITDLLRRKKREPVTSIQTRISDDEEARLVIEDIIPGTGNSPDTEFIRVLIAEEFEEALEELPDEQQEAFILNELGGKSFKEISEETGIPVNTLLSRKRRAVLYLRERLKNLINEI
jgi:RNA polymerase sigma factor (sigma-70 family)